MKLNVSAIKLFLDDQLDWYYQYVLKRVPLRSTTALDLGTLWHLLMEELAKTGSRDKAKEAARTAFESVPRDHDFVKDYEDLLNLFDLYQEPKFDEILAVEEAISTPVPTTDHVVIGRPDLVVRHNGKLWHKQNRTLSVQVAIPAYLAAASRDLHELVYAKAISEHFGETLESYGGTFMDIARKGLSKKRMIEEPQSAFVQEFIPIDPKEVESAMFDIAQIASDMQEIIEGSRQPYQNRSRDRAGWRYASDYLSVKRGQADIMDNRLFKHAESRYEKEGVVVE